MRRGRSWMGVVVGVAVVTAACGGSLPSPTTVSSPFPSPAASGEVASISQPWWETIPICPMDRSVRCGVLRLPIDHQDPSSAIVPLAFYVVPHTDVGQPPLEPVFAVPGGPGYSGWDTRGLLAAPWLTARHDAVVIDRRGTGHSNAIQCRNLQDGVESLGAVRSAVAECAWRLGDTADRYGSGDAALDLEALREHLGFDVISLLGFSAGSQVTQAYASRFPEHARAMVIDSGWRAEDPDHTFAFDARKPRAWLEVIAGDCAAHVMCTEAHPDPAAEIGRAAAAVRKAPWRATVDGQEIVIDELAFASILGAANDGGPGSRPFLDIVANALAGDPKPMARLARSAPPWPGDQGDVVGYSAGLNAASWCNDETYAWDRGDPTAVREAKLDAVWAGFDPNAFAPISVDTWRQWSWSTMCLDWPAPDRFEPVLDPSRARILTPTLILQGDRDPVTPMRYGSGLAEILPRSQLAIVTGAGHGVSATPCGSALAATFLETLGGDTSACATP